MSAKGGASATLASVMPCTATTASGMGMPGLTRRSKRSSGRMRPAASGSAATCRRRAWRASSPVVSVSRATASRAMRGVEWDVSGTGASSKGGPRGSNRNASEHAVLVQRGSRIGDRLHRIPVLEHLAVVVQPERIEDRIAALAGLTHGMDMHDHVVALGEDALDLALVVREFLAQEIDEALDAWEPVGTDRVVLD